MTNTSIITNSSDPPSHIDSIITTLTSQMTEALSKVQVSTSTTEYSIALINIKLDGSNYTLWPRLSRYTSPTKINWVISMTSVHHHHCQRMVDKLYGSDTHWQFHLISHIKIGLGCHCYNLF